MQFALFHPFRITDIKGKSLPFFGFNGQHGAFLIGKSGLLHKLKALLLPIQCGGNKQVDKKVIILTGSALTDMSFK